MVLRNPEHEAQLRTLLRTYGSFAVVAAVSEITQEILKDFDNNPGAVIHRNAPIIQRAVEEMGAVHPLQALRLGK